MKLFYALVLSAFLFLSRSVLADDRVYTFAVVPQQTLSEMAESWLPFLAWVSEKSQVKLRFVTAKDIPTFEKNLGEGAYDFAYMNPYHYTVFHKKSGYEALAKEKNRKLKGVLVVRNDSTIHNINELNGATIVFPAPAAFAASILPRAALRKAGINFVPKFVSSHESVYQNVVLGLYPAGGGIERTLELQDEKTKNDLRVLWSTLSYTPHAIASRHNLSKKISNSVLKVLTSMADDPDGLEKMKLVGFKGVEAAKDADWDDIRLLSITELDSSAE